MSETLTGRHVLSGEEPEGPSVPGDESATQAMEPALEPPLAVPTPGAASEQQVTCPECGTVAMVALSRRESTDFCARCDYPLFWTPSKIVLDSGQSSGESLRRLPGTSGRVTVASRPCPHCAEGNLITAEVCARCGGLMDPPPEPEPVVVVAPPPPAPEPEPERGLPWWAWIVGGLTLLLFMALVVYFFASR